MAVDGPDQWKYLPVIYAPFLHDEIVPEPPCTLLIVHRTKRTKMGWAVISPYGAAQILDITDLYSKSLIETRKGADVPDFLPKAVTTTEAGFKEFFQKQKFTYITALGILGELSRRYFLKPYRDGDSMSDHMQGYTLLGTQKKESGWHLDILTQPRIYTSIPCGFPGSPQKCCTIGQMRRAHGCQRFCRGCPAAGRCLSQVKLWCSKCDVGLWCSLQCKAEDVDHIDVCSLAQVARKFIGFTKACDQCGTPNGTEGLTLLKCGRCFDAFYCSVACQRLAWKSGHKSHCNQHAMFPAKHSTK